MLDTFRTFVQVVENKSFNKAAEKMAISASVVTRRIASLEDEMQTKLIQRTTRQLNLTEAGHVFYESCQDMLRAFEASKRSILSLTNTLSGTLKIGLPMSISHLHLSQMVHKFTDSHPELKIHIVSGNHLVDFLEEGFDVVIHCGKLPDSSFYCRRLGVWSQLYCASPVYLKQHGIPKHPSELTEHNCLDHYDNYQHVWLFNLDNKVKDQPIKGSIVASSSINLRNLAVHDLGIACLPSFTIINELNEGKLISVLEDYMLPPIDYAQLG